MIISKDQNSAMDFEAMSMNRDEMDKAEAFTIQIFLLLGAALISIGGRLYIRWRQVGVKNLGLDDGLAIVGVVSTFVVLSAFLICIDTDSSCRFSLSQMWPWRTL